MDKEQAINIAADWWTEKLRKKCFHNNGDSSWASVVACTFADMLAEDLDENKLDIFKSALKKELENEFNRDDSNMGIGIYLECDYTPCERLSNAAKEAEIPTHNFPYKTSMAIKHMGNGYYRVMVFDGYAQPYVDLRPV